MSLETRQYYGSGNICYDRYGRAYRCSSAWGNWGRWVLLGCLVVAFLVLCFLCSCISARRRRKAGRQPFYGTGWAAARPGQNQAQYNPQYQTTQQPQTENYQSPAGYPPNNTGAAAGYYGNSDNSGYYGGRQPDVEMQPPQNAYRAGHEEYQPPAGPPPGKY